jgi:hypothetical protein
VIPKLDTGSISGIVSNREHLPLAYAIASGDTVASTWAERNTGRFVLAFLPEGSYTVSVRDTLNRLFVRNGIEVIAGQDFDFGVILLQ